jgi:RHS repeat-associated protein
MGTITYANRYLKTILYGNTAPYRKFGDPYPAETDYVFRMEFDYGEFDPAAPYARTKDWDFRPDAFSDYRAGFEIRTTRLCRRVLIFHDFAELPGGSALVRSLDFGYEYGSESPYAYLTSVTSRGYIKQPDGTYTSRSLPPLEFTYQKPEWNFAVQALPPEDLQDAPAGLAGPSCHFIDLYKEGLSGILTELENGWYYKRNLGSGSFTPAVQISPKPAFTGIGSQLHLLDLDADARNQWVLVSGGLQGYFELNAEEETWQPFRTFDGMPNFDLRDDHVRMLDLDGDGRPEVVVTEDHVLTWYASAGRQGFQGPYSAPMSLDEEAGPYCVFSDPEQTLFLADMSGDGLTDIVRIRNGEVCYWPNLGYGRFGAKVSMDDAPVFDHADQFDPSCVRLADIDGSGTADLIYIGGGTCTCWMNRSGNAFGEPIVIDTFPAVHSDVQVTVADLLGNGVACLVWSSRLPQDARTSLQYIDLMNGKKPHLLAGCKNNLVKEINLAYTPSTRYYIEDMLAGKPWKTKLPFPVHCLSRVETIDRITGCRFVSTYRYRHGYYDHEEREFRGFGLVEQTDTETYDRWVRGEGGRILDRKLHQDPIVIKHWFHTGAASDSDRIHDPYAGEYWHEGLAGYGYADIRPEPRLPESKLVPGPGLDDDMVRKLSPQERREALRACKGMAFHSETFAYDAPLSGAEPEQIKRQLTPYSTESSNWTVELLQPQGQNKHAVFFVKASETLACSYERDANDPRIAHTLIIKQDEYGNVLESAAVIYPRIHAAGSLPEETRKAQGTARVTYSLNRYTNDIDTDDDYRLRLPAEAMTYEVKGVVPSGELYSIRDFEQVLPQASEATYHQFDLEPEAGAAQIRLIEHVRTVYRSDNLRDALDLYELNALGLPHESWQLAYTPELVDHLFGGKVDDALMQEGRFASMAGAEGWWVRSGTMQYLEPGETALDAQARFYQPVSYIDPYGAQTRVRIDRSYQLYLEEIEDALGNRTRVERFNFRTLTAERIRDPNHNISEVIMDELGFVKAAASYGKGDEADDLTGLDEFTSESELALIRDFFRAPSSDILTTLGRTLLQHASARYVYDFDAYRDAGQPAAVATILREEHFKNNPASPIRIGFEYIGGHGQSAMVKSQADPGPAKQAVLHADGTYTVTEVDTAAWNPKQLRWIGSGRNVLNNKGKPVMQFEPYYSVTHRYEHLKELVENGVTPILHYDALGRLIRCDMPDGTLSRTEFDSWKQILYDANDTVLESSWYADRFHRRMDDEFLAEGKDPVREYQSAVQSADHAGTPLILHLDVMGRPVLSVEHNKNPDTHQDEYAYTIVDFDIEGNLRRVIDARGNAVMEYGYDMLGNGVYQCSTDTGRRLMLFDILGSPLRTWDERGHEFQYAYDVLHRPVSSKVIGGDGETPLNHTFERIFYGEAEPDAEARNVRGRVVRHYDTGGVIETPAYDFHGRPKAVTRRLYKNYKGTADWIDANLTVDLESDRFTFVSETDALGRPVRQIAPDGSVIAIAYNAAGQLRGESVIHSDGTDAVPCIRHIDYNEKGQRIWVLYGNGVRVRYDYDPKTFRLIRLTSKRENGDPLQDWRYTYDPVGNITHIEDANIPVVFFDNQKITGVAAYRYDALYRLIEATGRENDAPPAWSAADLWNDAAFTRLVRPGDPLSMRNYTQHYRYDEVGNLAQMRHQAAGNNWTRDYTYASGSNRLLRTQIGAAAYHYAHHPAHGYMTAMPHLEEMGWSFKEELIRTVRQRRIDGGTPETTYYQYDGEGKRLRKITENQADPGQVPTKKDERIYIAGFERYTRYSGADAGLERTGLSLMEGEHRFVMIETETRPAAGGGRTDPERLLRYQLHNHLGSASLELDDAARVISYEEYHPYGTTAFQANNAEIKAAAKRYRYTGMERDEESGLACHHARYYVPWLGRWASADPAGISDGPCLYAYAQGNPVRFTDTTGLNGEEAGDFRQQGKAGMRSAELTMDIDEPNPVGHREITRAEARARALDVNNRQFLDSFTNRFTKALGVDMRAVPIRPPVSVAKDPSALITRRFGEITEMRAIFREAVKSIKDPNKYTPTQLKNKINGKIWEIIKTGKSPEAQRVRNALEKLGFRNVKGTGYVFRPETPAASGASRAFKAAPSTPAARPAAPAVPTPEPAPAPAPEPAPAPARAPARASAPAALAPRPSIAARVTSAAGAAVGTIGLAVAGRDIAVDLKEERYGQAALKTGVTALSFVKPAVPLVVAGSVIFKYHTDPTIEDRAFEAGRWAENKTGSRIVGGVVSAGAAVGISAYEVGSDFVGGVRDLAVDVWNWIW